MMTNGENMLKIRVKWKATIEGNKLEGIESEASWFLFDQRGGVYSTGPFKPPTRCEKQYDELTPLILIKGRYMSISDIEALIDDNNK